jgi:hypothetical protein
MKIHYFKGGFTATAWLQCHRKNVDTFLTDDENSHLSVRKQVIIICAATRLNIYNLIMLMLNNKKY